jgi:hypothetical protein
VISLNLIAYFGSEMKYLYNANNLAEIYFGQYYIYDEDNYPLNYK